MESLFPDLAPDKQPCQGLWDATPHVRSSDPDTSIDAARHAGEVAGRHMKVILAALRRNPAGLTSQELELELKSTETPLSYWQITKRVSDLRISGEIEDSGERRPTTSNRQAAVWRSKW